MGFGVPANALKLKSVQKRFPETQNNNLRFYERIYIVFDAMNDKSAKYFKLEPYPFLSENLLMVDSKNLFHCDNEVFQGILKSANAEIL